MYKGIHSHIYIFWMIFIYEDLIKFVYWIFRGFINTGVSSINRSKESLSIY